MPIGFIAAAADGWNGNDGDCAPGFEFCRVLRVAGPLPRRSLRRDEIPLLSRREHRIRRGGRSPGDGFERVRHKVYVQVLLRGPDMSEGSGRSPRSTAWFGLAIVAVMVGIGLVALPLASADSGAMTTSVYPLQVSVNPSSHTYTVGQSPGVTGTEKNTGSSTFKATACVVSVEVPGSHTYKSGACPGFKPFSVKAGATASQKYSVYPYKITSTTPTGTYHLKAFFKGTVGGKAYDSETVSFTLTVS